MCGQRKIVRKWRSAFVAFLCLLYSLQYVTGANEEAKVIGVAGGIVELPCDTIPAHSGLETNPTTVLLVVWYKDEVPVYSWDARPGATSRGHWASPTLDTRANWLPRPPRLSLRPARPHDAGKYRCRADFKLAPSKTTVVHLTIIEPPSAPRIYDDNAREIIGRAGPYREGDKPVFNCVVTGGNPSPMIRWFRGEETLESNQIMPGVIKTINFDTSEEVMMNERRPFRQRPKTPTQEVYKKDKLSIKPIGLPLRLPPLRRSDLLAMFSCKANNSRLLPSLSTTITIDMQLPPLTVEIEAREALRAGHREQIVCRAKGARPPSVVTWLLQGTPLPPHTYRQEESETGDISSSVLELVVGREQRGQQLACRASHPLLPPEASLYTLLTLDVLLPPDVTLRLGRESSFDNIVEGDNVVLECAVLAHPPPYKISWEHNGRTIAHEPTAGVEVDWGRLTFPRIQKTDSGTYNCIASNVEGDTRSNTLSIQVLFAPVCRKSKEFKYYRRSQMKPDTELVCEVESNPPPTHFSWSVNTSSGLQHIPQEQYSWSDTTSTLKYSLSDDKSNGEALCWASNKIGRQISPCSMQLHKPRPASPMHCALHNLTASEFSLVCEPGNDNGLTQTFELIVQTLTDDVLLANLTTVQPIFNVHQMPSGKELRLLLYAKNNSSRSDPVELFIIMALPPNSYKSNSNSLQSVLLLGITFGALIIFFLTIIVLKCREKISRHYNSDIKPQQISTGIRDEDCPTVVHEERNPDVVPLNKVEQDELAQMRAEQKWEVAARSPRLTESPPLMPPPISETSWSIRSLQGREVVTSRTPLPVTQESCV